MAWETKNRTQLTDQQKSTELTDGLDKAMIDEIKALSERYPAKRAALLPGLHMVQDKYHRISLQAMKEVAEILEIAPAEVMDTATFYDMYSRKPLGKHIIGVCESLSCELCGCNDLIAALKERLGINPGETTEDGRFSVIAMQCLGACDFAPAMLIDGVLHKTVSVDNLDEILRRVDD